MNSKHTFLCSTAGKTIVTRKEPRTYVAYPFDFVLPSSIRRGVTIKDINEMIKAKPPLKIKHKNDEEPNSFQASGISGKPVVHKKRIHTKGKGGNGTITITRTIG